MATRKPGTEYPKSAFEIFTQASISMGSNETVRRLSGDFNAQSVIVKALKEQSWSRFINLSRSYDQSRIVLALYAGDGIVVKIIPDDYLGERNAIYHLPAIRSASVEAGDRKYRIKAYPWLSPNHVSQDDVDGMAEKLVALGITFTEGDAHPKNVHRMPDRNRTLVGIDSSMYHIHSGNNITPSLISAWHRYVHKLFPIYEQNNIPVQDKNTDFSFVSIHDPGSGVIGFDHTLEDPLIMATSEPEKRPSFWARFLPG